MQPPQSELDAQVIFPTHPHAKDGPATAEFGTLLGTTHGGVQVFSCDYDSIKDKNLMQNRSAFQSSLDGTFLGFKWQCVELARRYLVINQGVTFESIPMAFDIFDLKSVRRLSDSQHFLMTAHPNGSPASERPIIGSLIIWKPVGYFKVTGHVAVVTDIQDDHIDIVEQNVDDAVWPEGINYSRQMLVRWQSSEGSLAPYTLVCTFGDTEVLGWMNLHLDRPVAE